MVSKQVQKATREYLKATRVEQAIRVGFIKGDYEEAVKNLNDRKQRLLDAKAIDKEYAAELKAAKAENRAARRAAQKTNAKKWGSGPELPMELEEDGPRPFRTTRMLHGLKLVVELRANGQYQAMVKNPRTGWSWVSVHHVTRRAANRWAVDTAWENMEKEY